MSSFSKDSEGTLAAGQMLGRYELLSPIARGGMGNVWAARLKGARGFRKLYAVKTILNVTDHPRLEQMLFEEATLASQIQHPNVVETIELGEQDGKLYLVMDLIDGESLSFILRKALPEGVPLAVAVNLVGQVCRGLQAAHDLTDKDGNRVGLVHRDVSPPNVLVTFSGTVKIVDFGVAITAASRACDSKEIKGKVSYFAPEQLRSQPLDARVDVFAAAILLYLLTTNRHPFRTNTESETINRILSSTPVMPPSAYLEDYPEALEAVLLRALEKERDRRYASAAAFLEALERAVPAAFGPAGDKLVTEYMQTLLHERMLERRHILRSAEDSAESSSPRASVLSVPAVVTARMTPVRPSRSGRLALLALASTLLGAVLTVQNFASIPSPAGASPAALAPREVTRAASREPPRAAALRPIEPPAPAAAMPAEPVAAAPAIVSVATAKGPLPRAEARVERPEEPRALRTPAPEAPEAEPKRDSADIAALAVGSGLGSASASEVPVVTRQLTHTSATTPIPNNSKPPKIRQVGSRIGHSRLAIDPLSGSYRVRVPPALQRTGQNFDATLNICVTASGNVSSVKVVRSAGLMLDPPLVSAVSRWRYRPLIEHEQAVPYCYVLRYQVAGR